MLEREKKNREALEFINTEMYVPQDHLLRKIDAAVEFSHIYNFVADLYSPDKSRPSIGPVMLFKMVLVQHLYDLPSLRRTAEEVEMNIAYKWYLGYLSPEAVFIDGTHIKANANINKKMKKIIPEAARTYEKQLWEEINADKEDHGKKPFNDNGGELPTKGVTVSMTDPDAGLFHKGSTRNALHMRRTRYVTVTGIYWIRW